MNIRVYRVNSVCTGNAKLGTMSAEALISSRETGADGADQGVPDGQTGARFTPSALLAHRFFTALRRSSGQNPPWQNTPAGRTGCRHRPCADCDPRPVARIRADRRGRETGPSPFAIHGERSPLFSVPDRVDSREPRSGFRAGPIPASAAIEQHLGPAAGARSISSNARKDRLGADAVRAVRVR